MPRKAIDVEKLHADVEFLKSELWQRAVSEAAVVESLNVLLTDLKRKDDELVAAGLLPPLVPRPTLTIVDGGRDAS